MNAVLLCQSWRTWVFIAIALICKITEFTEGDSIPAL